MIADMDSNRAHSDLSCEKNCRVARDLGTRFLIFGTDFS
jgi:hypothetical protein